MGLQPTWLERQNCCYISLIFVDSGNKFGINIRSVKAGRWIQCFNILINVCQSLCLLASLYGHIVHAVCHCVCCLCAQKLRFTSPRCFSTCPLRLNVKTKDSSTVKSRVFPSHTSIPIYRVRAPIKQTKIHEASPTSVWREIFWGCSKIPLI